MKENKQLYKIVNNAWKNGKDNYSCVKKYEDYWDGKLDKKVSISELFSEDSKTAINVIQPILETKLKAMLDAQFSISVLPRINNSNSIKDIRNQEKVADILDFELKNIFKHNNIDCLKEEIARWGFISGFGAAQVLWNTEDNIKGNITISKIDSTGLRWDKNCKTVEDNTFFAYTIKQSPSKVKDKYCKNPDGSYDLDKCSIIDELTVGGESEENIGSNDGNFVVNYKNSKTGSSGRAYSFKGGIQTNKYVELIVMFLIDDTLYAPEEGDSPTEIEEKKIYTKKYPNGRMIVFSTDEEKKIIFEDKELPESFNSLGNIDIFNPIKWNGIEGCSEIDDLIPIQNRINGSMFKYMMTLRNDVTSIVINKDSGIKASDFVKYPVLFSEREDFASILSNNGIEKATQLLGVIEQLKQNAYAQARINETMMYGSRQTGTTSADQVEALQESPLSEIRSYQRNFKDFMIDISNKCLNLIINNYNIDRIININDHNKDFSFARINIIIDRSTGKETKIITMYNKEGQEIDSIEFKKDWEFDVEVTAGTEVPRTRRENAQLMDKLIAQGVLNNIQDPDLLEMYLKSQDVPNYRSIIKLIREKQEMQQESMNSPEAHNWKEVVKNPQISKSFKDMFDALDGYSKAKQQMLDEVGLISSPGKLDDTPVTEITRESDVAEVATITPSIISDNPMVSQVGRDSAVAEQLSDLY